MEKNNYVLNIGIEIHCVLKTKSKLFSSAKNSPDDHPNTNIHPIDLALPGSTPVVNKKAVELAIKAGFVLKMQISNQLRFDRKNYFYPDLPKGFQITQYFNPLCKDGKLILDSGKEIAVERLFIEEDTAKQIHKREYTYLDYNRAGVPLIEIVSGHNMNSPKEAKEYVAKLRTSLVDHGITKGRFEKGEMRCDVNISVRKKNCPKLGNKVEIKNLNSYRNIEDAIRYEYDLQIATITKNQSVMQVTKRFDEATRTTVLMRSKENLVDYKYFAEPSILPSLIPQPWIDEICSSLGKPKSEIKKDFASKYQLSNLVVNQIMENPMCFDLFKDFLNKETNEKNIIDFANYLVMQVKNNLNKNNFLMAQKNIPIILNIISAKNNQEISTTNVKKYLDEVFLNKYLSFDEWKKSLSNMPIFDIDAFIKNLFKENPTMLEDLKTKPDKTENYIVGQAMKHSRGQANPVKAREIIAQIKKSH